MKNYNASSILSLCSLLISCSPVEMPVSNQYKLMSYSTGKPAQKPTNASILVSPPEAVAGYQTEQMLYIKKPFEIASFAHNAWVGSPANMLYPLIVQSLQGSHYFSAVASGVYADKTTYRIDTQLLSFQQNFLVKPSQIELKAKVVLTHVEDNRVISSQFIDIHVPCKQNSPYGGVVAANVATREFTAKVAGFVIGHSMHDQ